MTYAEDDLAHRYCDSVGRRLRHTRAVRRSRSYPWWRQSCAVRRVRSGVARSPTGCGMHVGQVMASVPLVESLHLPLSDRHGDDRSPRRNITEQVRRPASCWSTSGRWCGPCARAVEPCSRWRRRRTRGGSDRRHGSGAGVVASAHITSIRCSWPSVTASSCTGSRERCRRLSRRHHRDGADPRHGRHPAGTERMKEFGVVVHPDQGDAVMARGAAAARRRRALIDVEVRTSGRWRCAGGRRSMCPCPSWAWLARSRATTSR